MMPRTLLLFALLAATLTTSAQWQLHDAHTTADLRGIDNVGSGVAWASGTDGTILRTLDNGEHWQLCAKPPNGEHLDFRAIQAFDNNTAIIMSSGKGDLSRLYKTTDGCQTWKLLFTNPDKDGFWDAFVVWSHDHVYPGRQASVLGWILGDPVAGRFRFFSVHDELSMSRKRIFRNLELSPDTDATLAADPTLAGAFAASNQALCYIPWTAIDGSQDLRKGTVWPFTYLFVTGGRAGAKLYTPVPEAGDVEMPTEWKVTDLELGTRNESSGAFAIQLATDHRAGVIVGGDYLKPEQARKNAVYYDKATDNWTPSTTPPHGYRSAVAYDPTTKTWITVGPNGTDISTDDGRNWRALKPDPAFNEPPDADQHWNALSLPYAVGPHGRIGTLRPAALTPSK